MRGQIVVVKDVAGRGLVRKVWDVTDDAVLVATDETYGRLVSGESILLVGFPWEDVYESDGRPLPASPDWKSMKRWKPLTAA